MAVVNQTLQDSRYRTIIKTTTTGTNANAEILDVSDLLGYMALRTSLVTIAKISWSLAAQTDILWDASTNVVAFSMNGSGTYVFMPGQPSLANNAAAANLTGDLLLTNGTSVGTIVIEYHKVSLASGLGWTWTDTVLGPPQNQFGG